MLPLDQTGVLSWFCNLFTFSWNEIKISLILRKFVHQKTGDVIPSKRLITCPLFSLPFWAYMTQEKPMLNLFQV